MRRGREFIKEGQDFEYDQEKYRDMLLEAAVTIPGFLGFDRTIYGDAPKRKNRMGGPGSTKRE